MASGRGSAPHKQAGHMAAPTSIASPSKILANREPSTHGYKQTLRPCRRFDRSTPESRHSRGNGEDCLRLSFRRPLHGLQRPGEPSLMAAVPLVAALDSVAV